MSRRVSKQTKAVIKYTEQGMTANEIARKLKIPPQAVYHIRYRQRKKVESFSNGGGIAAVKRTDNAETGIVTLAQAKAAVPKNPTTPQPPKNVKPSIWARIKRVIAWL